MGPNPKSGPLEDSIDHGFLSLRLDSRILHDRWGPQHAHVLRGRERTINSEPSSHFSKTLGGDFIDILGESLHIQHTFQLRAHQRLTLGVEASPASQGL
jgi:hypothetical protein